VAAPLKQPPAAAGRAGNSAAAACDFSSLDPQQVLDALQAVGLRGDGRVLQLNSYENRVFQVFLEDGSAAVAKFYRPGRWSDEQIVEEHRFALELAAAEVPAIPPLVLRPDHLTPGLALQGTPPTLACLQTTTPEGHLRRLRFAVAARCAGREPELDKPDTLRQVGRFIGRMHAVGRRQPFVHRHHLNARADGERALHFLLQGGFVSPAEEPAWQQACTRALEAVVAIFEATFETSAPLQTLRLHGDCHLGNVLWRAGVGPGIGSPHVVDLDDAVQGPAVQDLWMLVSGDRATMAAQLDLLLQGYEQFSDFDDRERRLIEPLRTLRMVRHSAWLAARWSDPTFPLNFGYFGTAAYWSQQTTQLREQLQAMQQ
jgi:Ser/Thr protein kinase RdoA (MazF antagonist)